MNPRTTPLSPVALTDPVWTVAHLEAGLRLSERAIRSLIADPAFPAGFRLTGAASARRYWLREDLLTHFASLSSAPPARTAPAGRPAPYSQHRPGNRTDDAARAQIAVLRARSAGTR